MSLKAFSRDLEGNSISLIKSKRSQSALEYMMTYGWAILIIVIVAVILYSMGIFNPSSSITFTSSGFSPFTVSSSLCNNLGYKIAVLAGPIPNNANSLTISKVYLTSATGANATTAAYTLTNPVTLKSGQSATILIPNVACNAANVHYSISANIQYSYTASTLGLQTVNTTGTVAGTSIVGKPSVLTTYEPLTITNRQSSATPNPFQQMINFTSSDSGWTSISTSNFGQNVEFFYYNGTVIPSWLENYTSSHALWWLKIAAIPAGSSETVYVGFATSTTNLFNTVNDGEAPQIPCIEEGVTNTSQCSIYAEYDNGANVFNNYWDFAGTSLPSGLTIISGTSGTDYIMNNGFQLLTTTARVQSTASLSGSYILEMYHQFVSNAANGWDFGIYSSLSSAFGMHVDGGGDTSDWEFTYYYNNGYTQIASTGETIGSGYYFLWQIVNNAGSITTNFDSPSYSTYYTASFTNSLSALITFGERFDNGGAGQSMNDIIYWLRVRAYPPNGVMPTVSFGSLV